jgi:DNA-binding protein HU-beta
MTKADIVNEVSKNTGIEKVTVQKTVEAFMETVKDSLVKDKNVYLRGFGSFIVKRRAKKTARNIQAIGSLCRAERREKDIRWRLTSARNV